MTATTVMGTSLPAPAELAAWTAGYLLGHDRGYIEGYEHGDLEEAAALRAWYAAHQRDEKVRAARAEADRPGPRPGDFAGRPRE